MIDFTEARIPGLSAKLTVESVKKLVNLKRIHMSQFGMSVAWMGSTLSCLVEHAIQVHTITVCPPRDPILLGLLSSAPPPPATSAE